MCMSSREDQGLGSRPPTHQHVGHPSLAVWGGTVPYFLPGCSETSSKPGLYQGTGTESLYKCSQMHQTSEERNVPLDVSELTRRGNHRGHGVEPHTSPAWAPGEQRGNNQPGSDGQFPGIRVTFVPGCPPRASMLTGASC